MKFTLLGMSSLLSKIQFFKAMELPKDIFDCIPHSLQHINRAVRCTYKMWLFEVNSLWQPSLYPPPKFAFPEI